MAAQDEGRFRSSLTSRTDAICSVLLADISRSSLLTVSCHDGKLLPISTLHLHLLTARPRLINYTPQATMVRLLTIDAVNAYLTLTALSLSGGFEDPRLMLPGWISIATVSFRSHLAPVRD